MEGKTLFSVSDISIERLNEEDRKDLLSFSCGEEEEDEFLNNFFHSNDLYLCDKYHYYSVYVVRQKSTSYLLAIFTLANDSIVLTCQEDKEDLHDDVGCSIAGDYNEIWNKQTSFPAINIGHLGVSSQFHSIGIGSNLIRLILGTFIKYDKSGCQFVTVDSLNNSKTNKFYATNGFTNLSNLDIKDITRRMYILLDSVKE